MTRHPYLAAAALAFSGIVAGAAISHSGNAVSQGSTRTYIALGAHASGTASNAWFLCSAGAAGKPSCTTTPLP